MQVKTRAQAIEAGDIRFYNGKPCPKGHLAERFTTGGNCVECQRESAERLREKVREGRLARARQILAGGES